MPGSTQRALVIYFIEMLGEPGTYDATVYDAFPDGDLEGVWFRKRFAYLGDARFEVRSLPRGETLPDAAQADGYVLGGSYNSVHDDYPWQRAALAWLPSVRNLGIPLLAICGSHQLLARHHGAAVVDVADPPCAGTRAVTLTPDGQRSPLMRGIDATTRFHFGNYEQVADVPRAATLLALSPGIAVAALDYGRHWYSTQFHPEASAASLGRSWVRSAPALCNAYDDGDAGDRLIENFVEIVRQRVRSGQRQARAPG